MRRILLGLAVCAGALTVGVAQSQTEPAINHVSVRAGEGLWGVAARLCPDNVNAQFTALQRANPWYTTGLHPGTVLHNPENSCPPPATTTTTSSTTSSTTLPPTTTTTSTTTTLLPTTTTTRPATTTTLLPTTTAPTAAGWEALFRAVPLDETAITTWFRDNTGHRTNDLWNRSTEKCNIDAAWLAANEAGPYVARDASGRWIVERLHCRSMEIYVSNVTVRDIYIDGNADGCNCRGLTALGGQTGIVAEYVTLEGGGSVGISVYFPNATEPNQIVLRNVDTSGFRAGFYLIGGVTVEYGWSHDLHYSDGSHNTGASIRSRNSVIRRSLITDGNSAAINLYAENTPYTGVIIEETVLRQPDWDDVGPELGCYKTYEVAQPGETRVVRNNRFLEGGVGNRNGGCFTTWTGNTRFDGTPVP